MYAGAFAGAANAFVLCPLDLLKCRAQNNRFQNLRYKQEIKKIIRIEGYKGLYRGFGAIIFRESVGWAAFFSTYDYMKRIAPVISDDRLNLAWKMNAGGLSGIACWVLTLPSDNIKTL
jgi:hypothetical protein